MRPAQNLKPATYRCPLCGKHLPALSEHVLIWPEGDKSRRRHAHTECVLRARKAGRLPTEDEWRKAQRRERGSSGIAGTSAVARLRARLFGKD